MASTPPAAHRRGGAAAGGGAFAEGAGRGAEGLSSAGGGGAGGRGAAAAAAAALPLWSPTDALRTLASVVGSPHDASAPAAASSASALAPAAALSARMNSTANSGENSHAAANLSGDAATGSGSKRLREIAPAVDAGSMNHHHNNNGNLTASPATTAAALTLVHKAASLSRHNSSTSISPPPPLDDEGMFPLDGDDGDDGDDTYSRKEKSLALLCRKYDSGVLGTLWAPRKGWAGRKRGKGQGKGLTTVAQRECVASSFSELFRGQENTEISLDTAARQLCMSRRPRLRCPFLSQHRMLTCMRACARTQRWSGAASTTLSTSLRASTSWSALARTATAGTGSSASRRRSTPSRFVRCCLQGVR